MPLEVEAKFRVESHDPVRQRLEGLGATCLGCVLETNDIFDRSRGTLRQRGCGLRVRSSVCEETAERRATMTVKGPVQEGILKSREELEIEIDDPETAGRMLALLGYVRVLRYEKRRQSWRLDDCRIELDEPPHIGLFVEIEGPDESAVLAVQQKLGWQDAEHVRASYVAMLDAYRTEHGLSRRDLPLPGTRDRRT